MKKLIHFLLYQHARFFGVRTTCPHCHVVRDIIPNPDLKGILHKCPICLTGEIK